jgi:hypothetical protein
MSEIRGSDSSVDDDSGLLGYDAMSIGMELPMFERRLLPPSSGSKYPDCLDPADEDSELSNYSTIGTPYP